jgi:o-succinylbenzoate---CoA ligase
MNPDFNLFDFSRFGDAPALIDRADGRVVRYSKLASFLEMRSRGFPDFVSTWERPIFEHAVMLLAALFRGKFVIPISFRLPEEEARSRAELLGSFPAPCAGTILTTSGSSGQPRAVWHFLEQHEDSARASFERVPLEPGCGWLVTLPLHHVSGFSILIRCLLSGAAVVFPDLSKSPESQILDPAVTHLSVVSTQLARVLDSGLDLARLRAVLGGGGPFSPALVDRAIRAGAPLHLTYGMTETASQITTSGRLESLPKPLHSGRPIPGIEVRISASGEIEVRGPMVATIAMRLDGTPEKLTDAEGWFSTGDLGGFDRDGNLEISGRRDRMFISGGENIQPESIENALMGIAGIRRAVVVSRADERFGQRPVAFVAGEFDPKMLKVRLAESLEKFVIPDVFVPWPEEIPVHAAKPDFAFFKRLAAGL